MYKKCTKCFTNVISKLIKKIKPHPQIFTLPYEPFGEGDSERCIEIPWAFSCYTNEKRVLDIGYANAEERYLKQIVSLNSSEIFGIDLVYKEIIGIKSICGDIRNTTFPDNFFDFVFCISAIEHVGRDDSLNPIPYTGKSLEDDDGDFQAMQEIYRFMKPQGKIVLTIPFGMFFNYGWFIQYDEARLNKLIKSSNFILIREDFFNYNLGWHHCNKSELINIQYQDNSAPAAAGLACILLEKSY